MEKVSKEQRTYNEISKKKKNRYSRIFTSNFFKTIRNDRRFVLKEEILIDHPSLKSNDTGGQRGFSLRERKRERFNARKVWQKSRHSDTSLPINVTFDSSPSPNPSSHLHTISIDTFFPPQTYLRYGQ